MLDREQNEGDAGKISADSLSKYGLQIYIYVNLCMYFVIYTVADADNINEYLLDYSNIKYIKCKSYFYISCCNF